jgi:thioesterase domain-containing protein
MVPSAVVGLEALPLTRHGKVDRKALPAPREHRGAGKSAYEPPRDPLELELVRIWEELLSVHPIGVEDDFFALGGHSLLAVRLVDRITQRLGRTVSLLELFQNPTIASLAQCLRAAPGTRMSSAVVAIQASGQRRPFYCVHPAGGHLFYYLHLSRLLGTERPFYGFQAHGLEDGSEPDLTIEAMASRYISALREVQPAGPYLLGGWSMGGVVAYEMACQLRAEGEEIELLALIDARLRNIPAEPLAADAPTPPTDSLDVPEHGAQLLDPHERAPIPLEECFDDEGSSLARQRYRLDRVLVTHFHALRRYEPRSFDGRLILYHAAATDGAGDDSLGWGQLALGGVRVRKISATHDSILRTPAVMELAACLAEDLP